MARLLLLSAFPTALVEAFTCNGAPIVTAAPPRSSDLCASAVGPNRRDALTSALAAATSNTIFSAAANANDADPAMKKPNVEMSGYYNDPTHPRGFRQIVVKANSNQGQVVGADDKFESNWKLQSVVAGNEITLLLEPNGKVQPPSGIESFSRDDGTIQRTFKGKYNPTPPAGIEWPDGNKWTKADGDVFNF